MDRKKKELFSNKIVPRNTLNLFGKTLTTIMGHTAAKVKPQKWRKGYKMKKLLSLLLAFTMVFSTATVSFADVKTDENVNINLDEGISIIISEAELNGAPSGVEFVGERPIHGSYELEGVVVSTAISAIGIAIGVSGLGAFISLGVTTAISLGASHIYWVKKVSYGEDSYYYYVRTKVRLYSNAAHTKPLTDWKTVYTKKSKNSGASEGDEMS